MFGDQDIAMCEVKNEPRGDTFGERRLDNTICGDLLQNQKHQLLDPVTVEAY